MEYRRLGRTDLRVSVIGLGGIALSKVSPATARDMLARSLEAGINFFDTARGYQQGEENLSQGLAGQRSAVYVMSRSLHCSGGRLAKDLEGSLTALRSDYIDVYGIHNVRLDQDLKRVLASGGALEALVKAREAGKIRHIAISSHVVDILSKAMQTNAFDVIGFPLNVLDRRGIYHIFPLARELDLGIVTVKPFGMGLFDGGPATLRYVLRQSIDTTVPGARSVAEIDRNLDALDSGGAIGEAEREEVITRAETRSGRRFCRDCPECPPCPKGVPAREILHLADYHTRYHMFDWAWVQYQSVSPKANLCESCSHCVVECQYLSDVRKALLASHAVLTPSAVGLRVLKHRLGRSLSGREH